MNHAFLLHHRSRIRLCLTLLGFGGALVFTSLLTVSQAQAVNTNVSGSGLGTTVNGVQNGYLTNNLCTASCVITGGTPKGTNLFHSLGTLSVGTGDTASFQGPTVPGVITNILARVTGIDTLNAFSGSSIDGTLQSTIPGANLYIMNPRGFVFGPGAMLDIGTSVGQSGSFYATTADFIRLGDTVKFNAVPQAGETALLTSDQVVAFGFLTTSPAGITVDGSQLLAYGFDPASPPNLGLVGGQIDIANGAFLLASGGKLLLASTAWSGSGPAAEVTLPTAVSTPEIVGSAAKLPINISGSLVDATDQAMGAEGRGGTVYIRGGALTVDNSAIKSYTTGDSDGNATGVDIHVTSMNATGAGTTVETGVQDGFAFPATGMGGGILIQTTGNTVTVSDGATIKSSSLSDGTAGPLTVKGSTLEVNGGTIQTSVQANGSAEPLTVEVDTLRVLNGGAIYSITSSGTQAGNVDVTANQSFLLSGTDSTGNIRSAIRSLSDGGGATGAVTVKTASGGSGTIEGGARIGGDLAVATQSGLIDVQVPNGTLTITGTDAANTPSAILNVSLSNGQSGPISVIAGTLNVTNRGEIRSVSGDTGGVGNVLLNVTNLIVNNGSVSASTIGPGDAGAVTVPNASSVTVMNNGSISTSTSSTGNAGAIDITTGNLTLQNGATISSSSTGMNAADPMEVFGNAGTITLTATGTFQSSGSTVSTSVQQGAGAAGTPSSITITAGGNLNLTNGTTVSTVSDGLQTNAGNITLTAGNSLLLSDSRVTADAVNPTFANDPAYTASGGDIKLSAPNVINLVNGTIVASVQGNVTTSGGNIDIDPQFVILQGSNLLANAVFGTGGNITISGNVVLIDPTSMISASSQFGVSGAVEVRSPVSNVSGLIGRLPESVLEAQELLRAACAARLAGAQASSFVERGRDSIPAGPDGLLATPFLPPGPETPQAASGLEPGSGWTVSSQVSDIHVRRLLGADSTPGAQFLMDDSACRS